MTPWSRTFVPSPFGELAILWEDTGKDTRVRRVLLPAERDHEDGLPQVARSGNRASSCPAIDELAAQLRRFLQGDAVDFDLGLIDLGPCPAFQRSVLLAQSRIPRGRVSTYGRIAAALGSPAASRAVGTALSRNPFPLIIPCHRTIRADGDPGGFGGGRALKRALLELEGVAFSATGRVTAGPCYC